MIDPESLLTVLKFRAFLFMAIKFFKSFNDQINILKSRGLIISNEKQVENVLKNENYYRLSGYFKLFSKTGSDDFVEKTTFKKILAVYEFDEKLRILLDEFLVRIEINARTRIAYNFARTLSPDGYMDVTNFINSKKHNVFINNVNEEIGKNQRNPIIKRYKGVNLPIWCLVEFLTFGTLSKMYANLSKTNKIAISNAPDYIKKYNYVEYGNLLLMVTNLRNICAHHSRLYGNKFPYGLSLSTSDTNLFVKYGASLPTTSTSTPFELIFTVFKLLQSKKEKKLLVKRLKFLFFKYRHYIDISKLGFITKWYKVYLEC